MLNVLKYRKTFKTIVYGSVFFIYMSSALYGIHVNKNKPEPYTIVLNVKITWHKGSSREGNVCHARPRSVAERSRSHYRSKLNKWDNLLCLGYNSVLYWLVLISLGTNELLEKAICRTQNPGPYPKGQGHHK